MTISEYLGENGRFSVVKLTESGYVIHCWQDDHVVVKTAKDIDTAEDLAEDWVQCA